MLKNNINKNKLSIGLIGYKSTGSNLVYRDTFTLNTINKDKLSIGSRQLVMNTQEGMLGF